MNQNSLPYARSFKELIVYQRQRQFARRVVEVSKSFPRAEAYSLTDQIRRSARSIGGQIAETWAKRDYERYFSSKLTDADGEKNETEHWIETAQDCAYIDATQSAELLGLCEEIGRMLGSMKDHATSFCPTDQLRTRETPDFFTDTADTEN
jgi:four helix bundle protein